MPTRRGKYQGVFQIVRFNWPMYLVAAVVLIAGTVLTMIVPLPELVRAIARAGLELAGFWLILSLPSGMTPDDRSALYRADWLRRIFPSPPPRYAVLHVGLDEFSEILLRTFSAEPIGRSRFFRCHGNDRAFDPSRSTGKRRRALRRPPSRLPRSSIW